MSIPMLNTFSTLHLSPELISALPEQCKIPTDIQKLAIPAVWSNQDVLAIAQTGSGKTLAYGLPLLERVKDTPAKIQIIILVPTRELAAQVNDELSPIAQQLNIRTLALCGGVDKAQQVEQLALQPEILVATPGRLRDLLKDQAFDTTHVESVVLDESDRLLDMGFWPDVQRILDYLPSMRQTMMFSATLPDELQSLINGLLKTPVIVSANANNSVVEHIEETLYLVNKGSKANALIQQIKQHQWAQVLVFIGARDNADALCKKLSKAGISTGALHGNKGQTEREKTLDAFKKKNIQVLVATDLLARGIHIDLLPVVINVELPANPSVYIHRVGRTARAGEKGLAISLVCHGESDYLHAIRNLTKRPLPLQELAGFLVTDKPSTSESKRVPRDKQANRRTSKKTSITQFKSKPKQR